MAPSAEYRSGGPRYLSSRVDDVPGFAFAFEYALITFPYTPVSADEFRVQY